MANDFNLNQAAPINGLGTFSSTVSAAGPVVLDVKCQIPWAADSENNQSSNLQIVLKQNSTTLVTVGGSSANPTPTQGILSASYNATAAANDVFHVVLSSSNAIDSVPNNVKGTINFFSGPY
jgi:hypothetical protein